MKRGCDNAVEYVYQYIDSELTGVKKTRISMHLRRCGHCHDSFQFEKDLKAKIAASGKTQPPQELFDQIRALIETERKNRAQDG